MKVTSTSGKVSIEITGQESTALAMALAVTMYGINGDPKMRTQFHLLADIAKKLSIIADDELETLDKARLN